MRLHDAEVLGPNGPLMSEVLQHAHATGDGSIWTADERTCGFRGDDEAGCVCSTLWSPLVTANPLCLNVISVSTAMVALRQPLAVGHCFCQVWQLCVTNALSPGWIVTIWKPVLMPLSMMSVGLRLLSLAQ